MSDWEEEDSGAPKSFGGATSFGGDSWNGGGDSKPSGGFGRPSRGGGKGRGFGGFAMKESNGDNEESSNGFGGSSSGGFGSRGGGFGKSNGWGDKDGESGGGGRRGGFGGGRGGRRGGGFGGGGRGSDNEDGDNESGGGGFGRRGGGFGGGRGGGGFGGRGRRSSDNEDGEGGFGGRGRSRGGEGGEEGEDGEVKKRELYIPPAPPEDEDSLFSTMAAGLNFDKYDEIAVEVTGRDAPPNISTFDECGFFETIRRNIERCKYTKPTPVQKYAIPIILQGRDLMACAQTGSGKTAAFLLPAITRMLKDGVQGASNADTQSPEVLIISPTRELTLQIYNEARKFVHETIYRPVVAYGGTSVGHQLRQLESGCNILVGTPGRLLDFLGRGKVKLDSLRVFVLDEADRMLDMGFEPEIRRVVEQFNMPEKQQRQTLMFSATFPEAIQKMAGDFLHDHLFLTVGVVGGTTSDIQQNVVEVGEYEKREKLQEILMSCGDDRVLVFVETKRNADFLASFLSQEDFPTTSIHGDRFQREREEALRDFRSGRSRVLVATSVAARGLDIPKVKHVVNFDLPSGVDEYVHRIGRTGRIGNKGIATAFFQKDKDGHLARALVKVLADAHQDVPEFLEQAAEEAVGSNYGPAGGRFASKDIRFKGRRGGGDEGNQFGGDSSGYGNDTGGFGTGFGESSGGGFPSSSAPAGDDDAWD